MDPLWEEKGKLVLKFLQYRFIIKILNQIRIFKIFEVLKFWKDL